MSTTQNEDIAIWVCPEGTSRDVKEFPVGGREPDVKVCGTHGKPYIRRCPNAECPRPIYHPDDLEKSFHEPCGTKIPWAESRRETAEALMENDPFNSSLLGKHKLSDAEKLIREMKSRGNASRDSGLKTLNVSPGLSQADRDLIVPPSEHRPAGEDRRAEYRTPRKMRFDTTPSNGQAVPEAAAGITWGKLEGEGTTWKDLENTKLVRVQQATPSEARVEETRRWWRGLSATVKWVLGILGAIIAGVAVLLIRTWLIGQGIVRP